MVLFVSSAIYGFVNTSSCSRLKNGDDYDPQSPPESPETWSASTPETRPAEPLPAVAPQPEPAPGAPPPPPEAIADPPSDADSTPGDADPGKAP
ncbi:MAG: hypothetical protein K0R38_1464 [Polyangiaceae bacterium]|jgi:hypothetical protein|nr:hypothetical protein [Polyangiaceae bacterium]